MSFSDDDQIVLPPDSGPKPIVPGRVQLEIKNNNKAPLEENIQKVMLELTGEKKSRSGLDLVVVLDVSGSMNGDKLAKLKMAMIFVMKKLTLVDRLSIVKYSTRAKRICPLCQMTESSQTELEYCIKDLKAGGNTNITDGLLTALKVLEDRSVTSGRVGVIMLMSDGEENQGDAAAVPIGNVPVHTFGFGDGQDPKVLKAIADNSRMGGTYSDVRMDNLSLAFSQCLAGLLSVVAQNLTVIITQIQDESTIKQVSAGNYPQSMDDAAGSVIIEFGDIYIQEVHKVLVDLHLPATKNIWSVDIIEVSYTYKFDGKLFEANPVTVTVRRMSGLTAEEQQRLPEVRAEEVRLLISDVIKQATADADKEDLKSAQDKLVQGLKTLGDTDIQQLKAELKAEMEELLELMKTQEIYKKEGRPFAYSLLVSLATQRQTARGKNMDKFQIFATPAMQEFVDEAKKLDDIDELQVQMDENMHRIGRLEKTTDESYGLSTANMLKDGSSQGAIEFNEIENKTTYYTAENENKQHDPHNTNEEMPAHQVQLSEAQKLIEQLRSERDNAKKEVEELRRLTELQSVGYFAQYSSSELQHATNNFHDSFKLGEGGYGIVYRGNLHNTTIAIKVLKEGSSQGEKEFHQEIEILSKVRHPNLVTLIGACAENRAVIYEYLPNGSLEDRLRCKNNTSPLLWQARIRIAFEICSALSFLHCSKPHGIVHGDLKPDNILLDSNNVSKISDFGLCRELKWTTGATMAYHLTYYPKGTLPYMDPEYLSMGKITAQSDVYAFGIMLLRLVTCQDPRGIRYLVEEACQTKGKLKTLIKSSGGGWPSKVAKKMISLGLRCSDPVRRNRPDLSTEVWQELKSIAEVAFASPSSWAASLIRGG